MLAFGAEVRMTVDTSTARHILERDGIKHYFCCAGCKEKFAHAV